MTSNYLGQLKPWLGAKFAAAVHMFVPASISANRSAKEIIAAANGNVLDIGERYRLMSGHAPFFSLFTFFKDSH
ncbi:MAG: hypothetical protein WCF90_01620 [Methanomicrobiales archaeon]